MPQIFPKITFAKSLIKLSTGFNKYTFVYDIRLIAIEQRKFSKIVVNISFHLKNRDCENTEFVFSKDVALEVELNFSFI